MAIDSMTQGGLSADTYRARFEMHQTGATRSALAIVALIAFWFAIESSYAKVVEVQSLIAYKSQLWTRLEKQTRVEKARAKCRTLLIKPDSLNLGVNKQSNSDIIQGLQQCDTTADNEQIGNDEFQSSKELKLKIDDIKDQIAELQNTPVTLSIAGTNLPPRLFFAPAVWLTSLLVWLLYLDSRRAAALRNLFAYRQALPVEDLKFGAAGEGTLWIAPLPTSSQNDLEASELRTLIGWDRRAEKRSLMAIFAIMSLCAGMALRIAWIDPEQPAVPRSDCAASSSTLKLATLNVPSAKPKLQPPAQSTLNIDMANCIKNTPTQTQKWTASTILRPVTVFLLLLVLVQIALTMRHVIVQIVLPLWIKLATHTDDFRFKTGASKNTKPLENSNGDLLSAPSASIRISRRTVIASAAAATGLIVIIAGLQTRLFVIGNNKNTPRAPTIPRTFAGHPSRPYFKRLERKNSRLVKTRIHRSVPDNWNKDADLYSYIPPQTDRQNGGTRSRPTLVASTKNGEVRLFQEALPGEPIGKGQAMRYIGRSVSNPAWSGPPYDPNRTTGFELSALNSMERASSDSIAGRDENIEHACTLLLAGIALAMTGARRPPLRLVDLLAGLAVRYNKPDYLEGLTKMLQDPRYRLSRASWISIASNKPSRDPIEVRLQRWHAKDSQWRAKWTGKHAHAKTKWTFVPDVIPAELREQVITRRNPGGQQPPQLPGKILQLLSPSP